MGDNNVGPSLLLARRDLAHREHIHQHNHFHRRQAQATVTEIVATVSVVQQVDVDSNGNTYATQILTESSPAITNELSAATTTQGPGVVSPGSAVVGGSQASQSLLSDQSTTPDLTAISIPTHFPSLILSSNSTTCKSSCQLRDNRRLTESIVISSTSNSSRSSNSTLTSRTSLTYLTSASASDDFWDSSTSISFTPTYTVESSTVIGGNAGGTGVAGGGASSTGSAGNGTANSSMASTPVVVGGVVGSVAGAAILIFLLMALIRWKKRHQSMLLLDNGDGGTDAGTTRGVPPSQPPGGMTQRRSLAYGVPAVLASMTGYKRSSQKTETDRTISSTAGSERGFYRVSGRKLPSVLQSGGDGYGGGIDTNTLSGSSFYRDSQGFYGGAGSPTSPSHPPAGLSFQRDSGVPVMRPSPARTPVTEQSPFSAFPAPLDPPPRRPDGLGRSHPSQDGSQRSRFTEEV
jgi:hypothetical protein